MNISSVIGLLAAIIGLTATMNGCWRYLSSSEHSKKERLGAVLVVIVILGVVIGVSAGISYATASTPVGQQKIAVPFVPAAAATPPTAHPANHQNPDPTATPAATPEFSPTSAPTLTSTPTVAPEPTVAPTPTPSQ